MTTVTVPTIEDITKGFSNQIPTISGQPTYESLKNIRMLLKANAASYPCSLGGGNHGYLGLILTPAVYTTVAPGTPFVIPVQPPPAPVLGGGLNANQIQIRIRNHAASLKAWIEYKNVNEALKNQLIKAVEPMFLRGIRNQHVGFLNQSIQDILQYLFRNYGQITPIDIDANEQRMKADWNANDPIDVLINQIEDGMEFADDAGQPYTPQQVLSMAYTLVFKTGMFTEDCRRWDALLPVDKTWPRFKTHFGDAQRLLRLQQRTSRQSGFHQGNAAMFGMSPTLTALPPPPPPLDNNVAALANLAAAATAAEQQAMASLSTTISELHTQIKNLREENESLRKNRGNKKHQRHKNGNYCWTHGWLVGDKHDSTTCKNPAPGHQKNATRANTMGGSDKNKPEDA